MSALDDAWFAGLTDEQRAAGAAEAESSKPLLNEVWAERFRQGAKWGSHRALPDGTDIAFRLIADHVRESTDRHAKDGSLTWMHILREEFYEALGADTAADLREELLQVAAVCVSWADAIDRRPLRPVCQIPACGCTGEAHP